MFFFLAFWIAYLALSEQTFKIHIVLLLGKGKYFQFVYWSLLSVLSIS